MNKTHKEFEKLTSVESTLFRSLVMKLAHVLEDRIDIAEAVKSLKRHMKEPRCPHMQELKRLCRYLVINRRCVLTCARKTSEALCRCRWALIGPVICSEERARPELMSEEANSC